MNRPLTPLMSNLHLTLVNPLNLAHQRIVENQLNRTHNYEVQHSVVNYDLNPPPTLNICI